MSISSPLGHDATLTAPLIGRDHELQQLIHEAYTVIETGQTRLVTVVGVRGIGKTRLGHELQQVIARLPDTLILLSVQADPQSTNQPYSLLRLLVGTLFNLRTSDPPELVHPALERGVINLLGSDAIRKAHFIGQLIGYDFSASPHLQTYLAEPRQIRDRALRYARQCFAALAAQTPVVLLVDDAHVADLGSLEVLASFVDEGEDLGALVLCLAQPQIYERLPTWPGTRLDLTPLNEHEIRRLVGEFLRKAGRLPPDLRALIVNRAEGNPFYVQELITMLISDGVIVVGDAAWQIYPTRLARLRIPSSLADLLRARLNALPPAERDLLLRASVIGRFFWAELLAILCELEPVRPTTAETLAASLSSLERVGLLVSRPDPRFPGVHEYGFSHELMHEVAYELAASELRQRCHAAIATWLSAQDDERVAAYASQIATHYERGNQPLQAADWHLRAAQEARETHSLTVAQSHYHAVLTLLPPEGTASVAKRLQCYEELGKVQMELARLADAKATYQAMIDLAEQHADHAAAARAWNGLTLILDHSLEYAASVEASRRAMTLAEAVADDYQLALATYRLAFGLVRTDQGQAALTVALQALERINQLDDLSLRAPCTSLVGLIYQQLGQFHEARRYLEDGLRLTRDSGQQNELTTALNNFGYLLNHAGDYVAAYAYLEEALRLARTMGSRLNEIYILSNLALALQGLGDYVLAEAEARRGIMLCEQSRITTFTDLLIALSQATLAQGRPTEAVEAAQQALEIARLSGEMREIGIAWRALGNAIAALSEAQGATPCFAESARLFTEANDRVEYARTLRDWADHELAVGNQARAYVLREEARATFADLGLELEVQRMLDQSA
ncbi:MAG: ATP-binding protein [Oscillochloridaceae bacterium umkhey_bin13]